MPFYHEYFFNINDIMRLCLKPLSSYDFGVFYVISQIFAAIGTILSLVSTQQKKKVQILNFNRVIRLYGTIDRRGGLHASQCQPMSKLRYHLVSRRLVTSLD